MRTFRYYTFGDGVVIKAISPEHAAAQVFGGKPADYLASGVKFSGWVTNHWHEITRVNDGRFLADAWILTTEEIAAHKRQGSI